MSRDTFDVPVKSLNCDQIYKKPPHASSPSNENDPGREWNGAEKEPD